MYEQQRFLPHEQEILLTATSYDSLAGVALAQLYRMRGVQSVLPGIVCGPISNGGLGSKEANIAHFERVVNRMIKEMNGQFFSQIPFEKPLWRVQDLRAQAEPRVVYPKGAGNPLLEEFYRPVFESGHIGSAFFIKGWESSDGACWEHELCEKLGLGIWHLDAGLNPQLVQRNTNIMQNTQ